MAQSTPLEAAKRFSRKLRQLRQVQESRAMRHSAWWEFFLAGRELSAALNDQSEPADSTDLLHDAAQVFNRVFVQGQFGQLVAVSSKKASVLRLPTPEEYQELDRAVDVIVDKLREQAGIEPRTLAEVIAGPVQQGNGQAETVGVANTSTLLENDVRILQHLKAAGQAVKIQDIADALDIHRDTVSSRLEILYEDDRVEQMGKGRSGYAITAKGRQALPPEDSA